ncbi:hypothetical protein M0802_016308 [Mischocyttarus mexicanus]|nr:hypothetical protein M0802_016308 [Mischocyttarus mexicanus]
MCRTTTNGCKPLDKGALELLENKMLPEYKDIMAERAKLTDLTRSKKLISLPIDYPPHKSDIINVFTRRAPTRPPSEFLETSHTLRCRLVLSTSPYNTAKKGDGKGKGGGYTRAITLSPELAAVVGADQMARHEVIMKLWSIINERNLYDPKDKQFAFCDDELMKIIGVKRFRTFGMMTYLKHHFLN